MKKFALLLIISLVMIPVNAQTIYENALTAASYAYSHSKKAHGANNVFHTQEYADKAVEAFEEVEMLTEDCGCSAANEMAYEAKTNMISSLDQDTYERSRYYAKQAKELAPEILKEITNCQAAVDSDYADVATTEEENMNEAVAEVKRKEAELENKRRQLALEQAKLEAQIAEQQKKQKEFEALREAELKEQTAIKSKAENALANLENALQELSIVLTEKGTEFKTEKQYVRSDDDLQNETLDDTKSFYVNRAKELAKSAIQQFASFEEN